MSPTGETWPVVDAYRAAKASKEQQRLKKQLADLREAARAVLDGVDWNALGAGSFFPDDSILERLRREIER